MVLARQMYKKMPEELQPLLDANCLLIISVSNATRQSRATVFSRNKYICDIADKVLFVGVTENSSLYELTSEYQSKVITL